MSKQHQQENHPDPNHLKVPGISQAPDDGKGARGDRVVHPTHGIVSAKENHRDGQPDPVRLEREAHVLGKRDETEKDFAAHRPKSNVDWHKRVANHRSRRQKDLRAGLR